MRHLTDSLGLGIMRHDYWAVALLCPLRSGRTALGISLRSDSLIERPVVIVAVGRRCSGCVTSGHKALRPMREKNEC